MRSLIHFFTPLLPARSPRSTKRSGFSTIEVLVVIVILAIVAAMVIAGFNTLNRRQALDKDVLLVLAVLNEARSLTLSSKGDTQYGVHLDEYSITLFRGSSYNSSASTNVVSDLSGYGHISAHSLGGGDDILFERLTGDTDDDGTITLSLRSDGSTTRVITVRATGIIDSD